MQTIVSRGKTLQEAVDTGLQLLGISQDEVKIEVVQKEKKALFGLKSTEAVVKLTKLFSTDAEEVPSHESSETPGQTDTNVLDQLDAFLEDLPVLEKITADPIQKMWGNERDKPLHEAPPNELDGKVWVEHGQLFFQPTARKYPIVVVPKEVELYRNHERVRDERVVIDHLDFFELSAVNEERETVWEVKMDDQKLKVDLHITPGYRLTRSIMDSEPARCIELKVKEVKESRNTLTYGDVMKALEQLHVKHGFHQTDIVQATETEREGVFTIATGIEPIPGRDGWLELQVELDTRKGPREIDQHRVDHRDVITIPTVESGQVIAFIHPPIPGQPGRTVTNEPIPAEQTVPVNVQAGKGIVVMEDKVIATESGRPHVEKRKHVAKVSIMSKLTHQGDVDLASGNIYFKGDVEILGEVSERMKVESEGDVVVHKMIHMANVTANGAITANEGIVGAVLFAGKQNMMTAELGMAIEPIRFELKRMSQLIHQLIVSPGFKASDFSRTGIQPLLHLLMEKKFNHVPALLKGYRELYGQMDTHLLEPCWGAVEEQLSRIFLTRSSQIITIEHIKDLTNQLDDLSDYSQSPVEPDAFIHAPHVLSSRLFCNGDVVIWGESSVNSKIQSGGKVEIRGAMRGGEVFARFGVHIHESGAESNTATFISVPADQSIHIDYAREGTIIQIGNRKHRFTSAHERVHAKLNEDGMISLW